MSCWRASGLRLDCSLMGSPRWLLRRAVYAERRFGIGVTSYSHDDILEPSALGIL